jgi:hypothetical protein
LTVSFATGAWSGTTATPCGLSPTAIALPGLLVAVSIGVTLSVSALAT